VQIRLAKLSALDMHDYQGIVCCIYFQVIVACIVYHNPLGELAF
jgi:hypothetical protein